MGFENCEVGFGKRFLLGEREVGFGERFPFQQRQQLTDVACVCIRMSDKQISVGARSLLV